LVVKRAHCRIPTPVDEDIVVATLAKGGDVDAVSVVGDVEIVVLGQFIAVEGVLLGEGDFAQGEAREVVFADDVGCDSDDEEVCVDLEDEVSEGIVNGTDDSE
jgi:hypothetical protein